MNTYNCIPGTRYSKTYKRGGRRISGHVNSLILTRKRLRQVPRNCPSGQLRYTNSPIGTSRKACARGPGIGPLRKGELIKHGYKNVVNMSKSDRHVALTDAVSEFGSLGVFRKLNAVQIYTRRTAPATSKIFKTDMEWIRKTFGLKAF